MVEVDAGVDEEDVRKRFGPRLVGTGVCGKAPMGVEPLMAFRVLGVLGRVFGRRGQAGVELLCGRFEVAVEVVVLVARPP